MTAFLAALLAIPSTWPMTVVKVTVVLAFAGCRRSDLSASIGRAATSRLARGTRIVRRSHCRVPCPSASRDPGQSVRKDRPSNAEADRFRRTTALGRSDRHHDSENRFPAARTGR